MTQKIPLIVTKEKFKGKTIYIAECQLINVASQGDTIKKSVENLKEALISYLKSPYANKIFKMRFE